MTHSSHNALVILAQEASPDAFHRRLVLAVPPELPVFEAHFPEDPILPAYLEVREVVRQCRHAWPELGEWSGSTGMKFKAPIRPGMEIEVSLRRDTDAPRVTFTIRHADQVCAQGSLRFSPETPASQPSTQASSEPEA